MNFVASHQIRSEFSALMSQMYREEVPLYGDLLDLVADVNNITLIKNQRLHDQLKKTGEYDRLDLERHGAIRLGTAEELNTMRRVFAVMGMEPVGYYDLVPAGVPVHSTAFRVITSSELNESPFRVFTSLLRLELIQDEALRALAEDVLRQRHAYTEGEWNDILKTIYFVQYYQIASEPLTSAQADKILPNRNGSWDTRLALSSIRRDKDGRLLLGTVGAYQGKAGIYQSWANLMKEKYFPQLGKVNWQYQWTGKFGFTTDHIMRIFEPAPGIVAATAYNGRGITTGTMMGKAFAQYLQDDDREKLPLPFAHLEQNELSFRNARALMYDTGIALYHAGQCLRIIQ